MSVAIKSPSHSRSSSLDRPIKELSRSGSLVTKAAVKKVKQLSPSEVKMQKNFLEAVGEEKAEKLSLKVFTEAEKPLFIACNAASEQGVRPTMEDAHFDIALQEGRLVGIFDGHGERGDIARQVANYFKGSFEQKLSERADRDIRALFCDMCQEVQKQITDRRGGTTALVAYFDNATNIVYAMTLGDSELRVYRKEGEQIHAIPVSLVRNLSSPKDRQRALDAMNKKEIYEPLLKFPRVGEQIKALGDPQLYTDWLERRFEAVIAKISEIWQKTTGKMQYYPPVGGTVRINLSRSLGDLQVREHGNEVISCKPEVSMFQVEPGDRLVFACDGLWDGLVNNDLERQFIEEVLKPEWDSPNLAQLITDHALDTLNSTDNVTVITGNIIDIPQIETLVATPPLNYE